MNLFFVYTMSLVLLICGCLLIGIGNGLRIGFAVLFVVGSIYNSIWVLILKKAKMEAKNA